RDRDAGDPAHEQVVQLAPLTCRRSVTSNDQLDIVLRILLLRLLKPTAGDCPEIGCDIGHQRDGFFLLRLRYPCCHHERGRARQQRRGQYLLGSPHSFLPLVQQRSLAPYFIYLANKLSERNFESRVFLFLYSRIWSTKGTI